MDTKKDPGKFTIRFCFCMSDPRQQRAVEELNAQGRLKAQFLTNAILHYVEGTAILPPQEELEPILERLMKRMLDERANTDVKSAEKIAPQRTVQRRRPCCHCRYLAGVSQIARMQQISDLLHSSIHCPILLAGIRFMYISNAHSLSYFQILVARLCDNVDFPFTNQSAPIHCYRFHQRTCG